ncbi:MAG: SIMPL domain-containing protein [Thermoguttaceae bacterium]
MTCKRSLWLTALLVAAGWPSVASSQFGAAQLMAMQGGGLALTASGTATVQQRPTRMRMYVQLFGKGKNLEDALAKLKERREAAVLQLESLKADKKSIIFDGPTKSAAQSAQKRQIEAMVLEQMRSRGQKAKGLKVPQTVTVTASLTAEWPLEVKSQEELLVLSQAIEDKVKKADLSGSQEVEKLSPEEEELAEEAKQAMGRYNEQPQPVGQPTFVFVAVLSKQDRQKATAEAFKNAAAEAAELSKAANVELGRLTGVIRHCGGQRSFGGVEEYNPYYRNSMPAEFRRLAGQTEDADTQTEAFSGTPGPLVFTIKVAATYAVGK